MSTVNLKPFCGIGDSRIYFQHLIPLKNGHCACDGFIFVVADSPVPEPYTAPIELGRFNPEESAETARRGVAEAEYLRPVSEVEYVKVRCGTCDGSGVSAYEACDDCDGVGSFTHGHYDYDCKNCDGHGGFFSAGRGTDSCPKCRGTGLALATSSINFVGKNGCRYGANAMYIALIAKHLPNAKITITGDNKNHLFGVFDGGIFMLASMMTGDLPAPPPITLTKSGGVIHG